MENNALKIMKEAHEKYANAYECTAVEEPPYGAFKTELNGNSSCEALLLGGHN